MSEQYRYVCLYHYDYQDDNNNDDGDDEFGKDVNEHDYNDDGDVDDCVYV